VLLVAHGQEPELELRRFREVVAQSGLEIGTGLQVLQVMVAVALDLLDRFCSSCDLPE